MKPACIVALLCAVTAIDSRGQNFQSLVSFDGTNGGNPYTWLVQGGDGNVYGTTTFAGAYGGGTIFRMTPQGELTTLYNFCAQANCADGTAPYAGLVEGTGGNFYGITTEGGAYNHGTVFVMTPTGTLTTLYSFTGGNDGEAPVGLTQGADGNFYGITEYGANVCIGYGCGTVFKITQSGTLTTLYRFCSQTSCTDGGEPVGGLIQGSDGSFYGTTDIGGTGGGGVGTIFKITPTGHLTTLYSFCSQANCVDGAYPQAGLVQGTDGNFYGTAELDGPNNTGTFFKITPTGVFTVLHGFCARRNCADGAHPFSTPIQATDGNFYGTTFDGGTGGRGSIYRITPGGNLTTVHSFCLQTNCTDGSYPESPVFQATNGKFYGVTFYGGTNSLACTSYNGPCGTAYGLGLGLGPFVEAIPAAGKVGRSIRIQGNNLVYATGVSFNGTAATQFTIVSDTLIEATVPAGATTGTIQVATSGGTLLSNVPFRVFP